MAKNEIIILFIGYSKIKDSEVSLANCTCTLIKGKNTITIVDTRTPWDGDEIINELKKHNLNADDITHVVCTHGHSDHIGCNYLFQNAKEHIVGHAISYKNEYRCLDNSEENEYVIDEGIRVIKTPGHTLDSVSVLVEGNNLGDGIAAVVGDLFENEFDWHNEYIWMTAGSDSIEQQKQNRHRIADASAVIIPGHGSSFQVTDEIRKKLKEELNS